MTSSTHKNNTDTNGLAPFGITLGITPRKKKVKSTKPATVTYVALTYSAKELQNKPELEKRLQNIAKYFQDIRKSCDGTPYRFSQRDFLIQLLEREMEKSLNPPTS
jgi:hypothetical protein